MDSQCSDIITEPPFILARSTRENKQRTMRMPGEGGRNRMLRITAMVLVITVTLSSSSPAAQAIRTHENCKCFMCVCDLDPHPLPPEVPAQHHPPPQPVVPSPPPPSPVMPAPALPAYYPPATGYNYPPVVPYGNPWEGGYPAGEMYPPREDRRRSYKSGAPRRHGRASLLIVVALASAALSLLVRAA